ncbi:MAG: nickel-responsive transcriptional regulator NikR [Burkholderiales bacterium]|jgi:CopG family nickel-responsive transcriptional regulator|nr:nickel-responsive transcriptional regulator NikR [Burkholderiales bacterium]MCE2646793.1 nickel-responsive transcriptional regulator NikR [Burkholderiaceae bacterium]MCA3216573.1 nickel-responsive transcriptional regulator NikR [Burkholderiales bacterium]MCA3223281.1 nickel-responsive transcriptional regulator NikR [Burkholderiales bacterium]MCA3225659.1 nickel-responsive transcriptional regulator NikR [Burkholderiales bacterium]
MDRFTISLPEELAAEFDRLIAERGYDNRSEAVRDILRAHLDRMREARELDGHCVANLSYVYNHHERELADRLLALSHAHHDLALSTLHAHLDHDHCIESVLLKGPVQQVRRFANSVVAERGVRHGQLNLVMVDVAQEHTHADGSRHTHLKPQR